MHRRRVLVWHLVFHILYGTLPSIIIDKVLSFFLDQRGKDMRFNVLFICTVHCAFDETHVHIYLICAAHGAFDETEAVNFDHVAQLFVNDEPAAHQLRVEDKVVYLEAHLYRV